MESSRFLNFKIPNYPICKYFPFQKLSSFHRKRRNIVSTFTSRFSDAISKFPPFLVHFHCFRTSSIILHSSIIKKIKKKKRTCGRKGLVEKFPLQFNHGHLASRLKLAETLGGGHCGRRCRPCFSADTDGN